MLANGHHPNGLDQRMAGVPCVDEQPGLPEGTLSHRSPARTRDIPKTGSIKRALIFKVKVMNT